MSGVTLWLRFAEEIDRREQAGDRESRDPMSIGAILGMDAWEIAHAVGWLAGGRLIQIHNEPDVWVDAYTDAQIQLTEAGKRFARPGRFSG